MLSPFPPVPLLTTVIDFMECLTFSRSFPLTVTLPCAPRATLKIGAGGRRVRQRGRHQLPGSLFGAALLLVAVTVGSAG